MHFYDRCPTLTTAGLNEQIWAQITWRISPCGSVCCVRRPPLAEVSENTCPAGSLWTQHMVTKTWMTPIYANALLWTSCHPSAFSFGMFENMNWLALDLHVHWKNLSEIISPLQYLEHIPNGVFLCAFIIADETFHLTFFPVVAYQWNVLSFQRTAVLALVSIKEIGPNK